MSKETGLKLLSRLEQELEELWKLTGGCDPATGKMWLTPRMEREAEALAERWKNESIS